MGLVVDLDPDTDVVFTGDFCSATTSTLSIKNLDSENSVVFKIKTNAPQRYVVKPHKGSIGPSDTVTSVITLLPFNFKETEKYPDKFLIQTCLMSKINLEYVKHDFWTMVARDEVYERKLKCVFNIDKNGVTKRPPFNRSHSLGFKEPSNNPAQTAKKTSSRNGSITSMDRLLLDSSENSDLKEKLDQAKEQIKQLIKQGSDLREKNERLESQQRLEARNNRPGIECNGDKTASVQSTVSTSEEISQSHSETTDGKERRTAPLEILVSRPIMAAGFLSILILGIFLGRYIIL